VPIASRRALFSARWKSMALIAPTSVFHTSLCVIRHQRFKLRCPLDYRSGETSSNRCVTILCSRSKRELRSFSGRCKKPNIFFGFASYNMKASSDARFPKADLVKVSEWSITSPRQPLRYVQLAHTGGNAGSLRTDDIRVILSSVSPGP
jgi:hypothetical protein